MAKIVYKTKQKKKTFIKIVALNQNQSKAAYKTAITMTTTTNICIKKKRKKSTTTMCNIIQCLAAIGQRVYGYHTKKL